MDLYSRIYFAALGSVAGALVGSLAGANFPSQAIMATGGGFLVAGGIVSNERRRSLAATVEQNDLISGQLPQLQDRVIELEAANPAAVVQRIKRQDKETAMLKTRKEAVIADFDQKIQSSENVRADHYSTAVALVEAQQQLVRFIAPTSLPAPAVQEGSVVCGLVQEELEA